MGFASDKIMFDELKGLILDANVRLSRIEDQLKSMNEFFKDQTFQSQLEKIIKQRERQKISSGKSILFENAF